MKPLILSSLCCVWVQRSERADACLAAIAGTYASADMAGGVPDARPVAGPEVFANGTDRTFWLPAGRWPGSAKSPGLR
jgi:hypothetical protein